MATFWQLPKKIWDYVISFGLGETTAKRKVRLLSSASYADLRPLTKTELKATGKPAGTHVHKSVKRVTKKTPVISRYKYETKRAEQLYGMTPKAATEARKRGAISYRTAAQKEAATKAVKTKFRNSLADKLDRDVGKKISAGEHGKKLAYKKTITHTMSDQVAVDRERKLAGEYIPDGRWHNMIDVAQHYNDPEIGLLRASPPAYAIAEIAA